MSKKPAVTLDEIDAALNGPSIRPCTFRRDAPEGARVERAQWVDDLTTGHAPRLPLEDLMEVAAESPDGALAAVQALLRGLIVRHQNDDVTLAALVAIERLHLPSLNAAERRDI